MGHLIDLPNYEEMLLTDLSFKVKEKCLEPKFFFETFGFWLVLFFSQFFFQQYPNSNLPLFCKIFKKNLVEVFHDNIANLASNNKFFLNIKLAIFEPFCHFTHSVSYKNLGGPESTQWDFFSLLGHCSKTSNYMVCSKIMKKRHRVHFPKKQHIWPDLSSSPSQWLTGVNLARALALEVVIGQK